MDRYSDSLPGPVRCPEAVVVKRCEIAPGHHWMVVSAPELARRARPGQFAQVRCGEGWWPLMRRPFSLARIDPARGQVGFLFRVVGDGTRWLGARQPGQVVDLIGPLGKGFPPLPPGTVWLVAGGVGVAALLPLAEQLGSRARAMLGARTHSLLAGRDELIQTGAVVEVATEDGSAGWRGQVTELVQARLQEERPAALVGCGPAGMLQELRLVAARYRIPCWISLEARLGCGVGACRGCAVPRSDGNGYLMVCSDGPVFAAGEVIPVEV